jgi:hypothetical protein
MEVTPARMGTPRPTKTARKPADTAAAASRARGTRLSPGSARSSSRPMKYDT